VTHSQQIRIRNVRARHQQIQHSIAQLVRASTLQKDVVQPLLQTLQQAAQDIEQSCNRQGLTSAHLSDQSRQFLSWIKFLRDDRNLEEHLGAVRRVRQLCCDIQIPKHKGFLRKQSSAIDPQKLTIELSNLTSVYRYRRTAEGVLLQASEGFIAAEDAVLEALIKTAVFGKRPETGAILKHFSVSEEYSEVLLAMDLMVEPVNPTATQGRAYSLEDLFERVNQQYFRGEIAKPQLAWGKIMTRRKFGHYEPARNRIVLSLTLDDERIPAYAAEFVMYHEMLHIHHGETWRNGRRVVHTPAFRRDERKFEQYQTAEAELVRLARSLS
jgi:SprT-like family